MYISRRIIEISGILNPGATPNPRDQYFHHELKTPSLSLQCIALIGLAGAYHCRPVLHYPVLYGYLLCLVGMIVGITISFTSTSLKVLNFGGLFSIAWACVGFRLILQASGRSDYWTLPLAGLIAVFIAAIVGGPVTYGMLMALVWLTLGINFDAEHLARPDGQWALLFIVTAIVIGLMLSTCLFRLRHINHVSTTRLVDMAYKDHLTGIPNRRWFLESIQFASQRGKFDGAYLLMLDIDDFKRINDEAGHDTGDAVLTQLGKIITHAASGLPHGRLGGEEFAIVVPRERHQVKRMAEDLLAAVRQAPIAGRKVSVSIGVSVLRDNELSASMRRADEALYVAKLAGKDRVVFHREQAIECDVGSDVERGREDYAPQAQSQTL